MKTKRIISLLLAVTFMLLSSTAAFAARRKCTCHNSPVIIVNGMGGFSYYVDEGTENEHSVFPPENTKLASTVAAVAPGLLAMLGKNNVPFETVGIPAIYDLLKEFGCSKDGSSTYNVTTYVYKDSIDNTPRSFPKRLTKAAWRLRHTKGSKKTTPIATPTTGVCRRSQTPKTLEALLSLQRKNRVTTR